MQAQTQNITTSFRTRKSTGKRVSGSEPMGFSEAEQNDDEIFADSLYSVEFKKKSGAEVCFFRECEISGTEWTEDVFEELTQDLAELYITFHKCVTRHKVPDIFKLGLDKGRMISYVLTKFKELSPAGIEFNIEYSSEKGHHLVFYIAIDVPCQWNVIEIKEALLKLWDTDPELHNLFLVFLKSFARSTGLAFWWQGYYDYSFDSLEERLEEWKTYDDEIDQEELAKRENNLEDYRSGNAAWYEDKLGKIKPQSAKTIARKASGFKPNEITNIILLGTTLMSDYSIPDFDYRGAYGEDECYLSLDGQFGILWDLNDSLGQDMNEIAEASANEGVQTPCAYTTLFKDSKSLDLNKLHKMAKWMQDFVSFFDNAVQLLNQYTNER